MNFTYIKETGFCQNDANNGDILKQSEEMIERAK